MACALLAACGGAVERGVEEVRLPNGGRVYFKREIRGQNYDQLGVSLDGNVCTPLNPSVDYVYSEIGPIVAFYDAQPGKLTIYTTSALQKPAKPFARLEVVNVPLTALDYQKLSREYRSRNLVKLDVDVRRRPPCN